MRAIRRLLLSACWTAVLLGAIWRPYAAEAEPNDRPREAAVKVAFVYNFAKFAIWPGERFQSTEDPIVLCAQHGDLDREALHAIEGRPVGGHPILVRMLDPGAAINACHIYFASGFASETALQDVLARARRGAVLLVSDKPGFAGLGGHIGLIEDRKRLRFQVNLQAVTQAGVRLSSKLLQLAEIVEAVRK